MESKLKVGDKVKVVNEGYVYTTFQGFMNQFGKLYLEKYRNGSSPINGDVGVIRVIKNHPRSSAKVAIVENHNIVFMIGTKGLIKSDEQEDLI